MKKILTLAMIGALAACQPSDEPSQQVKQPSEPANVKFDYPVTAKGDVVDTYFGQEVADPYRWLEDDRSAETEAWVKAQNAVTQDYLSNVPYRDKIADTVRDMLNYERISAPFKEGEYTYFYKNDGLQNQSVVYRQKEGGEPEVFLDPNTFSDDGTVSLAALTFSEDGSLAAYQTSTGGSDWREVYVIDTQTKQQVEDKLVNVKFSGLAWYKNEGFYYSSYDKPKGSELSEKTDQHKVYYHAIGTPQADDVKVFGHTDAQKHRYIQAAVSDDNRFLFIAAANATSGNRALLKDLSKPDADFVVVKEDMASDVYPLTTRGDKLYLVTNHNAPNMKIVVADAANPSVDNWQDFIAETEHVLSPSTAGDAIFAEYMVDAISQVKQYDFSGKLVRDVSLPGLGSAGSFSGKKDDKVTYYTFANYTTPTTIYAYDIDSGETNLFNEPASAFESAQFVSEQVFYASKDGTQVPMIITHHKDTKLNGKNPTLLYGYGGFNVSLPPRFRSTVAAWLTLGGVYAVPNIRGGGEYGKAWHKAGTQMQKQNVFDDFIAAGEFLIEKGYTSSQHLAIQGGSNGGLLVGAVMTQRPDLAQVALPSVGVLDMLRYHTFTAGAGWAYDYGTSEQSEAMFNYLLGYSPLHNVKSGVEYPATLITTADHDDRVVPAHSFKFAATLQEKHTGTNPLLIRIETDAGHGAGTPISKTIEQYADIYGFTLFNMGITEL
ncbi:prolyl oligopeptidase family serine peptidase [Alteromonas oceanisediminis]|uniref:prolyl oligopeptidase family serine peptidase n=1 Tax=Alteromonas oceanisediminis TaxID=2836180 RepID=UPI001BDB693F|nr:prolyl oligopeptidase family serine peptidase [Alteromonas oceanisediminis]MBT0586731.1 prolyl oligopeptidase family serine peptidase [Alteromonas oceanisediminis]